MQTSADTIQTTSSCWRISTVTSSQSWILAANILLLVGELSYPLYLTGFIFVLAFIVIGGNHV